MHEGDEEESAGGVAPEAEASPETVATEAAVSEGGGRGVAESLPVETQRRTAS